MSNVFGRYSSLAKRSALIVGIACAGTALVLAILEWGYRNDWTGFGARIRTDHVDPYKTFWDWMQLVLVPLLLGISVFALNRSYNERQIIDRTEQQRESSLQLYLTSMTELMLDHGLGVTSSKGDEDNEERAAIVRRLARTRTLVVLPQLDGRRKGVVMRFLIESKLVQSDAAKDSVVDMNGSDLTNADLRFLSFQGVTLYRCSLNGADFRHADLREASLDNESVDPKWEKCLNLVRGRLSTEDARNADLREAKLTGSDLSGFDLRGTDLRGADLQDVEWKGSVINWRTRLEKKWRLVWRIANSKVDKSRLSRADLSGAGLRGVDLSDADLREVNLTGSNCSYALLGGADLTGSSAVATRFNGAWLGNARLDNSLLLASRFEDANLAGANMSKALLIRAYFNGAKLQGACLRNCSLSDADFRTATVTDADLSGSDLDGVVVDRPTWIEDSGAILDEGKWVVVSGAATCDGDEKDGDKERQHYVIRRAPAHTTA